jgi:hypothetical protein
MPLSLAEQIPEHGTLELFGSQVIETLLGLVWVKLKKF